MGRDYTQATDVGHAEAQEDAEGEMLDHSMILEKDEVSDDEIKEQIPDGSKIHVQPGKNFDFSSIKIEEKVPSTRCFRVLKYKNPRTQRQVKILKCDFEHCKMFFRKWHNFFDHLRVHTKERPFVCSEKGCDQSFTQKANLNKHLAVHLRRKKLSCKKCTKHF